ncbi:hypothetical protein CEXT_425991 [Caerostris extrusa]|uniref:Uncharacterized protein n=1 Tax=Caerostris extrusa TaxID=172846 RepID=A0AAV4QCC9_CAEEX|nr:hypothetical protein CEXT_425991 [Caerostris extrusa]
MNVAVSPTDCCSGRMRRRRFPTKEKGNDDDFLAEPDAEKKIQPYTINLGKGFMMELKEFRNAYYIGLVKFGDVQEVRNRFNIPIDQIGVLKKAVEAMSNYVDAN